MKELKGNNQIIVQHVRKADGRKFGTFVARCDSATGHKVMIGFAKANNQDVFNGHEGYRIANARIEKQLKGKRVSLPLSLEKSYDNFIVRCKKYFRVTDNNKFFIKIDIN